MKIGIIIQARLTSSRFPKKILAPFMGKSVLEYVVERCYEADKVDEVIIAAPHQLGVCLNEELFIGSENDVLDRYYQCATKYNLDAIIRITSDCPLIPSAEIERVIDRYLIGDTQYVTNRPAVVDGWDCEIFSYNSLKEAWLEAKSDYDREHVTSWIKQQTKYNPILLDSPKLSVDTEEDLERMKNYVIGRKTNTDNRRDRELRKPFPKTYTYQSQTRDDKDIF